MSKICFNCARGKLLFSGFCKGTVNGKSFVLCKEKSKLSPENEHCDYFFSKGTAVTGCEHTLREHEKISYKFCPFCGKEIERISP